MKPEEQQIELAKLDGWQKWDGHNSDHPKGYLYSTDLPDYLSDLNAVHELEKKLDWKEQGKYAQELVRIALNVKDDGTPATLHGCFILANATAAQKSEAILKVKGLWK